MRGRISKGKLIATLIVVMAVLITGVAQYVLWQMSYSDTVEDYQIQVATLKATILNVGELVDVYTVRTATYPGQKVVQEDLEAIQVPASFVRDSYVLDPSEVVGRYYKVEVQSGTALTRDLIMSNVLDDTDREIDIVVDTWPIGLKVGDYVDFEITYPMGEKYVVLTHKRVNEINAATIKMVLNGTERHLYSAVLVDYFLGVEGGATINLVKYVEPGVQKIAQVVYAIPKNILSIILMDPNIVNKVEAAINEQRRTMIDSGNAAVIPEDGNDIASGRNNVIGKINGASVSAAQAEKDRLEQEAYDALVKAGEWSAPVVDDQPIVTNEIPTVEPVPITPPIESAEPEAEPEPLQVNEGVVE